jgi:hypothetical protein
MDYLSLALPIAIGGASALAWVGVRRHAKAAALDEAATRAARAAALGWFYDSCAEGEVSFVLRGESAGVEWKVLFRTGPEGETSKPTLTWATRSVQGGATELRLVGRERYERDKAHIGPVIRNLSNLILTGREIANAQERASFLQRTPLAEVGSEAFRASFALVARNHRLARSLIDAETEELLTKWPEATGVDAPDMLSAWLDWQGMRIDLEGRHRSMASIEHLVKVGVALASRFRRHAAAPGVTRFMPN